MRLLDFLASAFIDTFGITRPSEKGRRRASWFIFWLLVAVVLGVATIGIVFYRVMHSVQ